jgi:hypothetical protein
MDIWSRAPIVSTTLDRDDLDDPAAILRTVAATCRNMREEFGDIMRVLLATAPHDKPVAASLNDGTARYRRALVTIARRLADLHALRGGRDVEQAVDVLWFYFGYSGLFTLRDENGWSYDRAERWLGAQANWALLRNNPLVEGLGKSANARTVFGATCSPVRTSARPPSIWKIGAREEARGIQRERKRLPLGRPHLKAALVQIGSQFSCRHLRARCRHLREYPPVSSSGGSRRIGGSAIW